MGEIFIILMVICAAISLFEPWIGVLYGYLFVVLTPQDIWWWDFSNIRATYWVLLPTSIGVMIGLLRGKFDIQILKSRRNLFILLLWMLCIISYFAGAYISVKSPYRFTIPAVTLSRLDKMFFLYFIACLCIDSEKKAKALYVVMLASFAYLTYWANHQYLIGNWSGRLNGPTSITGGGIYQDQNDFAMAFVVAQPFFWFFGGTRKTKLARWFCWLIIPLSWNAVFLTGSRGGFVGVTATIFLIAIRSRRKLLGLALIPVFFLIFLVEGGPVMTARVSGLDQYHVLALAHSPRIALDRLQ